MNIACPLFSVVLLLSLNLEVIIAKSNYQKKRLSETLIIREHNNFRLMAGYRAVIDVTNQNQSTEVMIKNTFEIHDTIFS